MARLHRVAYFMCGDSHRAEDLVQAMADTGTVVGQATTSDGTLAVPLEWHC